MKPALAVDLGVRDYADTWNLQLALVARRQADEIPDVLLLVEHPDVLTLGRKASARGNVLDPSLPTFEIERGGDVTYHGPGQLVGYPILKLEDGERDLHAYLRALEEALIGVCGDFGVAGAGRRAGLTGVWIDEARKVVSIGIAVRRWVTLHGFALNVSTDLGRFAAINPCGLDARVMTSLSAERGQRLEVDAIKPAAIERLGAALRRTFTSAPLSAVDGTRQPVSRRGS